MDQIGRGNMFCTLTLRRAIVRQHVRRMEFVRMVFANAIQVGWELNVRSLIVQDLHTIIVQGMATARKKHRFFLLDEA